MCASNIFKNYIYIVCILYMYTIFREKDSIEKIRLFLYTQSIYIYISFTTHKTFLFLTKLKFFPYIKEAFTSLKYAYMCACVYAVCVWIH